MEKVFFEGSCIVGICVGVGIRGVYKGKKYSSFKKEDFKDFLIFGCN